jgi:hypothetical protein
VAEDRTGGWQSAEQESDRTEKQTGRLQDRGLTGAELQNDSGQETGGGKNRRMKWLEYLSNIKIKQNLLSIYTRRFHKDM